MSRSRPIPQLVVRAHDPRRVWRIAGTLLVLWALSLAGMWHYAGTRIAPANAEGLRERFGLVEQQLRERGTEVENLKEQLAVSQRADQVSRTANEALQQSLRDSEEEIAGLRADLAFYQRLVGGSAERRGLTVHDFKLDRIGSSGGYAYALTLTQNLKKGAVSEGEIALQVEGVRGEALAKLDWQQLASDPAKAPLRFSFKYFQRLEGSIMVPAGFTPNRITVRAQAKSGEITEQTFDWGEALDHAENKSNVRQ
jgi:hypothetical protein